MNHRDAEDTEKAMAGQSVFRPESVRDGLHTDSRTEHRLIPESAGCDLRKQPCLEGPQAPLDYALNPLPRRHQWPTVPY